MDIATAGQLGDSLGGLANLCTLALGIYALFVAYPKAQKQKAMELRADAALRIWWKAYALTRAIGDLVREVERTSPSAVALGRSDVPARLRRFHEASHEARMAAAESVLLFRDGRVRDELERLWMARGEIAELTDASVSATLSPEARNMRLAHNKDEADHCLEALLLLLKSPALNEVKPAEGA